MLPDPMQWGRYDSFMLYGTDLSAMAVDTNICYHACDDIHSLFEHFPVLQLMGEIAVKYGNITSDPSCVFT